MEILAQLGIEPISILIYLINVGLLLLVLGKFLYQPVMKVLDERRALIKNSIEEAETLKKEFAEKFATMEAEKASLSRHVQEQMEAMHTQITKARQELEEDIASEKEKMLTAARADIEAQKASMEKEMKAAIIKNVEQIVLYILQNKVPASVINESIEEGWKQFTHQHKL